MAEVRGLHQIEYRHHQTMDLSPAATSIASPESLAAWDSSIRAWVRHPDTDTLSQSACYQVFPNGQAALAWRYWDVRAANRTDGTLGRPLVSRVLVGPGSMLTPEAAIAACRAGLSAEWAGPLPGEVPDDAELPMVEPAALTALTREMTSVLDRASAEQDGLQAVLAAVLAEPTAPLAISIHDVLIHAPLGECVQCPLLWGLRRIAGPLFGPAERRWSFSTFELPLGKTDPASLPAMVFRQTQDGTKTPPPSRWRREAKVRPFEDGALSDECAYAGMLEPASWLVAQFRERGGDGLQRFLIERAGSGSFATRIEQISGSLRKAHQPPSPTPRQRLGDLLGTRVPAPEPEHTQAAEAETASTQATVAAPVSEPTQPSSREPEVQVAADTRIDAPQPTQEPSGSAGGPGYGYRRLADDTVAPPRQGQAPPVFPLPSQGGVPVSTWWSSEQSQPDSNESASSLLRELELLGEDQKQFELILDRVYQANYISLEERGRCWTVISSNDWHTNICRNNAFRSTDLARIFGAIVIPALTEQPPADALARWALEAPRDMVAGLLAAARTADAETWTAAMGILEPVLAYRWAIDNYLPEYWDERRAMRRSTGTGRDEGKTGRLGRFLSGRRS